LALGGTAQQASEKVAEEAKNIPQALERGHIFYSLPARVNSLGKNSFATRILTSAAKAATQNKAVIAALKRCATQNAPPKMRHPKPRLSASWKHVPFPFTATLEFSSELARGDTDWESHPCAQNAQGWGTRGVNGA